MGRKNVATIVWLVLFFAVLAWSAWQPKSYDIWFLEVVPALVALVLLAASRHRFPLTSLAYWLILVHSLILMVGGHYTYAEVPLFDWLRDMFDGSRNQYDKVGHFAQGFVPAIIAREILLRLSPLRPGGWLFFLVTCVCLAVSAFYELIEWWVAIASDSGAEEFLATQGDPWDTQSDMLWALIGALVAQLSLAGLHDRQLQALPPRHRTPPQE